ncbi:MAG: sensor histidine kinase [Acidimicrobiales bacterium]
MHVPLRLRLTWNRVRNLSSTKLDLAMGTVFVLLGLLSTSAATGGNPAVVYEPRDATAFALIIASTAPYLVRRRYPLPVFAGSAAALTALSMSGYNEGVIPLVALVGAYTVGAHRPAIEGAAAGVIAALVLVALFVADVDGFDAGELASNAAIFGSAILVGRNVQSRRLRLAALERGHDEAAARAATDERLRIAQELHDVVAHSLGVIAVQAGVGMHVLDTDPEEARRALDHISRTSRSSLAEIRGLLGVVRGREGGAEYTPAPTLAELPRLVQEVELAGLPVDLEIGEDVSDLPAGVELAAYRIVQEALTNALRHAHAGRAAVRVHLRSGAVVVEVEDDGRGTPEPAADGPGGHGILGMRERAALYGGSVVVGSGADGGFRVAAVLPVTNEVVA